MMFIQSQQSKSRVCLPRLSAHLFAATLLFGGVQATWGQDATESRWSTSNPPTPAMVHAPQKSEDNELRRLPPIDEEVTPEAKPSEAPQIEEQAKQPQVSSKPQSSLVSNEEADPVNWSSPKVVIGPETSTRTVSHEEVVSTDLPSMKASRYSSTSEAIPTAAPPKGQSRFSQAAPELPKQEVATQETTKPEDKPAANKPAEPVFARVFDEQVESSGITQPAVAAGEPSLSPIFACRLLGLRATKSESNTLR